MPEYVVTWTNDITADSPREAAELALAMQRDPTSIATVFEVRLPDRARTLVEVVDLDPQEGGSSSPLGPPPPELEDAWDRYQHGGDVESWELTKLDEWRAERAEEAGF